MNSAAQEGNALDRSVSLTLFLLGIGILRSRSFQWSGFFRKNLALTAYLLFALASVLWSDFPFLVIKKWVRDLGSFVMVLVVISDAHPVEAVSTLFRRVGYPGASSFRRPDEGLPGPCLAIR